jgi:FlaA1/EpsC-like NDP-sugar epimerase
MTIPEAVELVIQAGAMGEGGDVFVLDMGKPVKIYDLAVKMIRLSGLQVLDDNNPDGDIEIKYTGLRPGEKLYEELLIGDNVGPTEHQQIYRANEEFISWKELDKYLNLLKEAESSSDHTQLRNIFKQTVSGYKPEEDIVDVIYLEQNKPS